VDERENERRKAEISQLLQTLKSDPGRGARQGKALWKDRQHPARQPSRVPLRIGLALVAIGLVALVFRILVPPPPPPETVIFYPEEARPAVPAGEEPAPYTPAEVKRLQLASRVSESKVPRPENSRFIEITHDYEQERSRLLKRLEWDGRGPKFFPVWELAQPADGKPVECYCLLRQPLDEASASNWKKAGMFQNESEIISPLLRRITVANAEDRRRLDHAFVDRLAYSVLPEPK